MMFSLNSRHKQAVKGGCLKMQDDAVPSTSQGNEYCPDIHSAGHMQDRVLKMNWNNSLANN